MPEKSPLVAYQSLSQGRLVPSTSYGPTDGEYVYALGSELLQIHDYAEGSYVSISQDFDLAGVNLIRFDFGMLQPLGMPAERDISGSPATATLKKGGLLPGRYPYVTTRLHQPFKVPSNARLVVEVDGGGDQTVIFGTMPTKLGGNSVDGYLAAQLCDVLNTQLTGALASVAGDTSDPIVKLSSNTFGASGSIEVKNYIGAFTDANTKLCFNQKIGSPTAFYGADDLSAIIAPDGELTSADVGRHLDITGCAAAGNNGYNRLMAVMDDGITAILQKAVTDEAVGFTARLLGPLWLASVWIDSQVYWQTEFYRGADIKTEDLAINVSKLTGTHKLTFRLELPFGRIGISDTLTLADTTVALKS